MYLVSACLAGFNTRYDGANSLDERVRRLVISGRAIAVCPEQLGGLPTPRPPLEFLAGAGADLLDGTTGVREAGKKQKNPQADGQKCGQKGREEKKINYAEALIRGARETLRIARLYGIEEAILKDGSPSCGASYVHSLRRRRKGKGVTAELLSREGLKVRGVDSLQG